MTISDPPVTVSTIRRSLSRHLVFWSPTGLHFDDLTGWRHRMPCYWPPGHRTGNLPVVILLSGWSLSHWPAGCLPTGHRFVDLPISTPSTYQLPMCCSPFFLNYLSPTCWWPVVAIWLPFFWPTSHQPVVPLGTEPLATVPLSNQSPPPSVTHQWLIFWSPFFWPIGLCFIDTVVSDPSTHWAETCQSNFCGSTGHCFDYPLVTGSVTSGSMQLWQVGQQVSDGCVNEMATGGSTSWWSTGQENGSQQVSNWQVIEMVSTGSVTSGLTEQGPMGCWPTGQWHGDQWAKKTVTGGSVTGGSMKGLFYC